MPAIQRSDRADSWWVDFRFRGVRMRKRSPVQTRRGAEDFERVLRVELLRREGLHGTPFARPDTAFAAFAEKWCNDYVTISSRPSTRKRITENFIRYLLPAFGSLTLEQVTDERVTMFTKTLRARGLSPKTVNNTLSILRCMLRTAQRWGYLTRMPAVQALRVPEPSYVYLSADESDLLVRAAPVGYWRTFILFLLHTGCRFGEAAALRWEDVALDDPRPRIRIRRSAWEGQAGPTKNGRTRSLPITPQLHATLRTFPHDHPYVFALLDGSLPTSYGAVRYLKQICERAGVRRISWHALRHTFATELSTRNVPIRAIQDLLGHSSVAITCRYTHVDPRSLDAAVAVLPVLGMDASDHLPGCL